MNISRSIVALSLALVVATPTEAAKPNRSPQYKSGYNTGAKLGRNIGYQDGSGLSGTNAKHTNATCLVQYPKNREYDRGYIDGCRVAYEKTFNFYYRKRQKRR
jgi:hypothetical protein